MKSERKAVGKVGHRPLVSWEYSPVLLTTARSCPQCPSSLFSLESFWEHAHLSKGELQEAQGTASRSLPQPPLAPGKQAVEMFVTVTFSRVCFLVISSLYLLGNLRKLLQMY